MFYIAKKLFAVLVRCALILSSFVAFSYASGLSDTFTVFSHYFIYMMFLGLLILGSWFHKPKACLFIYLLLLIKLSLDFSPLFFRTVEFDQVILLNGIALLLSINILLLGLFQKSQIRWGWTFTLLIFLGLQTVCLFAIAHAVGSGSIVAIDYGTLFDNFTLRLGHLSAEPLLIVMLCFGVAVFNELLVPGDFYSLAVNSILSVGVYNFLDPMIHLPLNSLFLIVGLLTASYIFKQIYEVAYMDQLTGIPSRRALHEQAGKLTADYVVAMVDIDHFKKFNDKYGHDVGDDVLAFVAAILSKRANGSVFRYGGEEFTLLFSRIPLNECIKHLDEVRQSIADSKFKIRRGTGKASVSTASDVTVTVSIGVAEQGEKYRSFGEVIKAADKALYRAKKKGRNCVSK